jgi:hypothetical protein
MHVDGRLDTVLAQRLTNIEPMVRLARCGCRDVEVDASAPASGTRTSAPSGESAERMEMRSGACFNDMGMAWVTPGGL